MFEPLSDIIRMRRKQLGLTQEKLARMAKVSRRQLSLLEDGHNVSLLFLTKIADALELTDIPVDGCACSPHRPSWPRWCARPRQSRS